ncbi:hypothetical protein WJR50_32915 [Catalinimonas sp. 4WD22]|uniref:hypothetical protein n=1 Tax=Catalinimonas locisalis TaxID=3133978 RepID=UPI00310112FC
MIHHLPEQDLRLKVLIQRILLDEFHQDITAFAILSGISDYEALYQLTEDIAVEVLDTGMIRSEPEYFVQDVREFLDMILEEVLT